MMYERLALITILSFLSYMANDVQRLQRNEMVKTLGTSFERS